MRERTTWNPEDILKRASARAKTAEDPTAMNQDHIQRQPSADKYLTGDPSTFAEDVHPSAKNWKAEYSDGQTSRNEIGMPEMRDDTFNHPEQDPGSSPARGGGGRQASLDEETLVKKADLCCKVARQILGPKAVEAAVEDQALALMGMSDADLIATVNRMAQQDEGQQGQQTQDKQAQLPPEFIENMEKKKEEAKDKDDKKAQDQQGQGQQAQDKQAQMPDFIKEKIEEKKDEEKKEAGKKLGQLEQMAQQLQTMAQQIQQMMGMYQQQGQQQAPMQQEQQGQQQEQQAQMQEQQALDQMLQQQSNDQMIDQMLQQGQPQQQMTANNELGVQLDSPSMDIGEVSMTPEDDVLTTLFANNAEVQNAQQAHTLQHGAPASLQVQASSPMTRTASTRTMGTRPTAGVSSIGGLGSPAPSSPSGGDVEKLSSLWNSAPDVSDVFRS